MNFSSKTRPHRKGNTAMPVACLMLLIACGLVSGCGKKDAGTVASPPSSLKGQAPTVSTGETKGTPEEEAAKQRGVQQGQSIEAANDAAARAAAEARAAGK